jgi:glycosyltransferase involved in cell wall biosynthesis
VHILIFLDQNPASLGGVQASVLLQQKYLELAGHRVTVAAPASKFAPKSKPGQIIYPSFPLTPNREYNANANLGGAYRQIVAELAQIGEPVDVVHVQADWWGALLGVGFAQRQNLPLVNTLHTQLMIGATQVVGAVMARLLIWTHSETFGRWVDHQSFRGRGNGWTYLRQICSHSQAVIAPSGHFARLAKEMGVAAHLHVVPTGVDDASLEGVLAAQKRPVRGEAATAATAASSDAAGTNPTNAPVVFAWSGRFSQEKRMMEFLEAFNLANIPAHVQIFGNGPLQKQAEQYIRDHNLQDRVTIVGRVSHTEMLHRLANADALIQTSVGFETQGMTVYEAGVVGTPSVLCDWNIADDLPENSYWRVPNQNAQNGQGIQALANTLAEAYEDIRAGRSKHIDLRESMFQSQLYKRSIEIYEGAIAAHGRAGHRA